MKSKIYPELSGSIDGNSVYLFWFTMVDGSYLQFFLYTGILTLDHDLAAGRTGAKLLRPGYPVMSYWDLHSQIQKVELITKIEAYDPAIIF